MLSVLPDHHTCVRIGPPKMQRMSKMAGDAVCLAAVLAYTVAAISPNMDVANAVCTPSPFFRLRSCCRLC